MYKSISTQLDKQRIILVGFDSDRINTILSNEDDVLIIIFDDSIDSRVKFEALYPLYKNKITLYEGCIKSNIITYFDLRRKEGITPEMHRLEVCGKFLKHFILLAE